MNVFVQTKEIIEDNGRLLLKYRHKVVASLLSSRGKIDSSIVYFALNINR